MKKFFEQFAKPSDVLGSLAGKMMSVSLGQAGYTNIQMKYRNLKPVIAVFLTG